MIRLSRTPEGWQPQNQSFHVRINFSDISSVSVSIFFYFPPADLWVLPSPLCFPFLFFQGRPVPLHIFPDMRQADGSRYLLRRMIHPRLLFLRRIDRCDRIASDPQSLPLEQYLIDSTATQPPTASHVSIPCASIVVPQSRKYETPVSFGVTCSIFGSSGLCMILSNSQSSGFKIRTVKTSATP